MMYEVQQLTESLVKSIDGDIRRLEESLGEKSAKTYEEYVEKCGVITGLLTARRLIKDLTKNMESHDD
jgi:6-phosphofructokinase